MRTFTGLVVALTTIAAVADTANAFTATEQGRDTLEQRQNYADPDEGQVRQQLGTFQLQVRPGEDSTGRPQNDSSFSTNNPSALPMPSWMPWAPRR